MKYVDEFRDPSAAKGLLADIGHTMERVPNDRVKLMEICGGHTHTIYRYGIGDLLPERIELVHGPGCPVCVVPMGRVDDACTLASQEGVTFCSFGDVIRVPGRDGSLLDAKATGADVRVVYSPMDALGLARRLPDRQVVFFAIGFETTTPSTAATVLQAQAEGIANFSVFSNHVCLIPAIQTILDAPGQCLDGFIGPGHVSSVIGMRPYRFIAEAHRKPFVISGFEALDLLQGILMLTRQLADHRSEVENQYSRVVTESGNEHARRLIDLVFEERPHFEWRGLGTIARSAVRLRREFGAWDAEQRFTLQGAHVADPRACQCGEILKGALKPWECKVFGTACTPERPIGACMVSAEGACAACYAFGRIESRREPERQPS